MKISQRAKQYVKQGILFLLSILSVLSLIISSPAYAIDTGKTCDTLFYSKNDILYYSPCSSSCGSSTGNGAGTVSSLRGSNNGDKIFNFWTDAGLSPQQAAGITGSMQHEGGFSPFRQEESQSWPSGGWGIAQFTGGQRDAATAAAKAAVGDATFNQYYSDTYGGAVTQSSGYIPSGVPSDINDKFLLSELNYLLTYIQGFKPSSISLRVDLLKQDFNQTVDSSMSLYSYLKTVTQASDAAEAWTYLYEFPGDIKNTATERAASAERILSINSAGQGISTSCGGNLTSGGMTLQQAQQFMKEYTSNPDNVKYIGGAGQDCNGGPLSNCVSFSAYFINKYTTLQGFGAGTSPGNGSTVVANIVARNPTVQTGHSPRPYAIFSTASGVQMCGSVKCGHTGVILGVDQEHKKVIVGEAACGADASWDGAHEYDLSQFDSADYTYAYTDGLLKGGVQ